MRINLFKIYIASFFLLSNFIMFAQGPGDDDGGGGLEGGDPPAATISGKIIWLGITAIIFAFYCLRKGKKIV